MTDELTRAVGETADAPPTTELAPAKINLALHVLGRRTDGYHQLETLVTFADFTDVVTVAPSPDARMHLALRGPFAGMLSEGTAPGSNLVIRAASELSRLAKSAPARRLTLTKRIPVAAGLGGGSADAAAALRLLMREWQLTLDDARLKAIALDLGADVPMCLSSRPLIARGIGGDITPVSALPALSVVIAQAPVAVRTAEVFAKLPRAERAPLPALPARFNSVYEVVFWLRQSRNDLSEPAEAVSKLAGSAARVVGRDPECLFARMSGSGAAAFGIFLTREAAERAAGRIKQAKPAWFVTAATTRAA
ncbi:MAG TPA: 4-(cytidine 5'-diphospho)-2-C-methyl-D-erythritol kinase [Bauldia sp.]|nr:4-(cytidine 5'-diphospho)-2-C-methyl-D-erythritol kinase [Bauldia sp.]